MYILFHWLIKLVSQWLDGAVCDIFFYLPMLGVVIYLHTEGTLYVQKCVPSWFSAGFFFTQKGMKAKIWKQNKKKDCQFFDSLDHVSDMVTVKYHEVDALFVKCPPCEKLGSNASSVHTNYQYQVRVLGTDHMLKILLILRHLNGCNFLIPNPRELIDPSFLKRVFNGLSI